MMATTANATDTQNSGQFLRTTAIPPTTNAISAMVEPVHAASVRPWCTCLPRLLVGCVKSERCAVLAMVGSLVSADRDMHSEHLPQNWRYSSRSGEARRPSVSSIVSPGSRSCTLGYGTLAVSVVGSTPASIAFHSSAGSSEAGPSDLPEPGRKRSDRDGQVLA